MGKRIFVLISILVLITFSAIGDSDPNVTWVVDITNNSNFQINVGGMASQNGGNCWYVPDQEKNNFASGPNTTFS